MRNYRKDGTPFWNELSLSTVKNPADGQTCFVGVQKDVTAQVKTCLLYTSDAADE